jgi:hypothetical protein
MPLSRIRGPPCPEEWRTGAGPPLPSHLDDPGLIKRCVAALQDPFLGDRERRYALELRAGHGARVAQPDGIPSAAQNEFDEATPVVDPAEKPASGMLTFTDDEFKAQIEADTGLRPGWAPESFRDPAADVRQSLARIAANPFIPHKDSDRGFVYSVTEGTLTEIT